MEVSRKLNLRLQGAKLAAAEQAFTATLPGLKNRRAVDHVLPRLINRGEAVTLMQVDLEFFKAVNDTHGHPAGDHVLQSGAQVLVQETRQGDCVARGGGDEFVIILVGELEETAVAQIAGRLIERIEAPIRWRGETCEISASIGIATNAFGNGETGETLWARADTALYAAKNGGRGRFRVA
jgi:diguanylate cyclase (GGDEF)-like protein